MVIILSFGTLEIFILNASHATQTLLRAKSGSGLADIVTSAGYDATCANPKTCNQPNWTRDAKGNQTDFTYDATHGGVLTVTLPAPTAGAVRPQTRYTYSSLEAWYQNASGVLSASGQPLHLLTRVSTCRTQATCSGSADETRTEIGYGPAGVGNNRLPVTVTLRDGTGTLVSSVTSTHDSAGNGLTVDGPLAGTADTTRMHYDALRRVVGVVAPDPDSSGPRKHVATRNGYSTAGHLATVETGVVNGQSDADWATFVPSESVTFVRSADGRKLKSSLSSGGTIFAVEQVSYDTAGRPECIAARMNPALFGSLPSSACTLGTEGSYGADRITKLGYNAAGQVTSVTSGFGTSNAVTVTTTTYTSNGRTGTVADGKGNLTTYEYDGFDRLSKTRYPVPGTAGSSSTTDFEQRTYDANSNVTSLRARTGDSIGFTPDNLNRIVLKDIPDTTAEDVYFSYDNQSRMLAAAYDSPTGPGIDHLYDGLGRLSSRTAFGRTLDYGYDLEKRLRSANTANTSISLTYDPLGVLNLLSRSDASGTTTTAFLYDGMDLVAEYDVSTGAVVRRYVHGPGVDEPAVMYVGSGTNDRRYLHSDERGSIVAISNSTGSGLHSFKYSPWGESANADDARFGYTGQVWLAELQLYYYKARMYSPRLGRFLQPDPIGYEDGMNLYAYVNNDPTNRIDPLGLYNEDRGGRDYWCAKISAYCIRVDHSLNAISDRDIAIMDAAEHARPRFLQVENTTTICERRDWHNLKVAEKVAALRAAGFKVAVGVRVHLRTSTSNTYAVADYIARGPTVNGVTPYIIGEIKTGNATLTQRQLEHYHTGLMEIRSNNAGHIGLLKGDVIPALYLGETRYPGCPQK